MATIRWIPKGWRNVTAREGRTAVAIFPNQRIVISVDDRYANCPVFIGEHSCQLPDTRGVYGERSRFLGQFVSFGADDEEHAAFWQGGMIVLVYRRRLESFCYGSFS